MGPPQPSVPDWEGIVITIGEDDGIFFQRIEEVQTIIQGDELPGTVMDTVLRYHIEDRQQQQDNDQSIAQGLFPEKVQQSQGADAQPYRPHVVADHKEVIAVPDLARRQVHHKDHQQRGTEKYREKIEAAVFVLPGMENRAKETGDGDEDVGDGRNNCSRYLKPSSQCFRVEPLPAEIA